MEQFIDGWMTAMGFHDRMAVAVAEGIFGAATLIFVVAVVMQIAWSLRPRKRGDK